MGALLATAECKRRGGKPKKARNARVGFEITIFIIIFVKIIVFVILKNSISSNVIIRILVVF